MIQTIGLAAHWLDAWLREHMGRTYSAVLTAGLVLSIVATLEGLNHAFVSGENIVKIGAEVAFELVLLVNQLSQFHDFREARRARRKVRRRKVRHEDDAPESQPPTKAP